LLITTNPPRILHPDKSIANPTLTGDLQLVDWTGRAVRDDKRGSIPTHLEPILDRLGFDEASWLQSIKLFKQPLFQAIGSADQMRRAARNNLRS